MNTVVLHLSNENYLGRTFECCGQDEIRLATNLICQDTSTVELNDEQFSKLEDNGYYYLGLRCGVIYLGGLEAVS